MPSAEHEQQPIRFKTPNFMRPLELQETRAELTSLQRALEDSRMPSSRIKGKGLEAVRQGIARLQKQLQDHAPPKASDIPGEKRDRMVTRAKYLESKIREGMPTDREMRRNPTGATDKHIRWERKNKRNILEWKNLQLAIAGDEVPVDLATDMCNVERLRPVETNGELSMHNEQIRGREFYDMSSTWNSPDPNAACYEEIFENEDPEKQALIAQVQREREERNALMAEVDEMRAMLTQIEAAQADAKNGK